MNVKTSARKLDILQKRYEYLWQEQTYAEMRSEMLQRMFNDIIQSLHFTRRKRFTTFWESIEEKLAWSQCGIKLDQLTAQELNTLELWSEYLV